MTPFQMASLAVVLLLAIGAAWLARFDVKAAGSANNWALVTDRWTGTVYVCWTTCDQVFPATK